MIHTAIIGDSGLSVVSATLKKVPVLFSVLSHSGLLTRSTVHYNPTARFALGHFERITFQTFFSSNFSRFLFLCSDSTRNTRFPFRKGFFLFFFNELAKTVDIDFLWSNGFWSGFVILRGVLETWSLFEQYFSYNNFFLDKAVRFVRTDTVTQWQVSGCLTFIWNFNLKATNCTLC